MSKDEHDTTTLEKILKKLKHVNLNIIRMKSDMRVMKKQIREFRNDFKNLTLSLLFRTTSCSTDKNNDNKTSVYDLLMIQSLFHQPKKGKKSKLQDPEIDPKNLFLMKYIYDQIDDKKKVNKEIKKVTDKDIKEIAKKINF